MRRYVKIVHADDETIDDRDNPESIEEDDASDKADNVELNIQEDSDDDVEFEKKEEEEEGKEEDLDDPWRLLIEETFELCQSEFDERVTEHMARQGVDKEDARRRVYDNMLPTYRKALVKFSFMKCCGSMPWKRTVFTYP